MRFTREKLLKNISERQLRNYQKAYGYAAFAYPRKELTINEMVKELFWHFSFSAHMSFGKSYDPVDYLNRVDIQRRIALDISRCLVTAKKLGEEINCSDATPDSIFNFMIADLSSHARCLSDKALRADFGYEYQEAAFTVYEEVIALIRRLKLTREGYDAIKAIPGATISDASKALPAADEGACKDPVEPAKAEKTVRPERAIAPMATTVVPEAETRKAETEKREEMTLAKVTKDTGKSEESKKACESRKPEKKETHLPEPRRSESNRIQNKPRVSERREIIDEPDLLDEWTDDPDGYYEKVPTDPVELKKWVDDANKAVEDMLAEMKEYMKSSQQSAVSSQ